MLTDGRMVGYTQPAQKLNNHGDHFYFGYAHFPQGGIIQILTFNVEDSMYDITACPDIEAHRRYPGHAHIRNWLINNVYNILQIVLYVYIYCISRCRWKTAI